MNQDAHAWLLLMHSIPPKPPYLRAKVMRRLTQLGALALKRSAYLLPLSDGALEDFQWLRQEIRDEGGDAWIVEARFVAGLRDDEIRENFRAIRAAEYAALAAESRALLDRVRDGGAERDKPAFEGDRRRLLRRLEATRGVDFFHANGRDEVEALMSTIDRLAETTSKTPAQIPGRAELRARTWITRTGVKVDRMASAWLIRRFIDPAATFVFVAPDSPPPVADALRFDMFDGEFTHDGNRCTFEVLLDVAGLAGDPGLAAIARIVHDIDLRDDRYQRAETAGVTAFVDGIVARFDDDHRRIAESTPIFDTLYASLGGQASNTSSTD
ncbi:MAG: hypothetical protein A3H96_25730 [Acidobacteria bacterium RIFCSPLOWO2_02_FULL_67_36]|nr:MAG: hypothetical protein A3H96_25730 [Acidobacteria bacterium RIFCSPLOWO2_02_FULL_67_36]OFW19580.1 MAG: hypothetical protein A3G21_21470 [Acidobacteria bacterium RIFCSPLOWO2_12_FULL_66_21]